MKPVILSILLLVSHSILANSTTLSTFYRVIDATPYDFIYSVRTVSPENKTVSKSGGRLQKYFKLVRKETIGNKTEIAIQVESEFLPTTLQKYALITIDLEQLKDDGDAKRFQTHFTFNKIATADALLSVSPHTRGSLLQMDVQQTSLPLWIFSSAVDLILKINLSSSLPKGST